MEFRLIPKSAIRATTRKPAHIAISTNGRFCLSTAAVEQLKRDDIYEYAFLLWAEKERVIAIRPTNRKDERAYRIIKSSTGRNAAIAGKGFCDLIGYDYTHHRSFTAHWNEADQRFEINLADTKQAPLPPKASAILSTTTSAGDLDLWRGKADVCKTLRVAKRTLERMVQEGLIERRWRPRPGRRGEPVYNPDDVKRIMEDRVTERNRTNGMGAHLR